MNVPTLPPPPVVVVISDAELPAEACLVTVPATFERAENPVTAGDPVVPPPKAACCRLMLTCAETGVIKPHASPRAAAALMKADLFMVLWIELWVSNAVDIWVFAQHSHPI